MKLNIYQVDAFTKNLFGGNPAAVIQLPEWLDNQTMQNIAMENNLSETAFFVKRDKLFEIRWMTPVAEVDLCGHATLATSYVIFNILKLEKEKITFNSRSGKLTVTKNGDLITLNFPINVVEKTQPLEILEKAIGLKPVELLYNKSHLAILSSEEEVRTLTPDFSLFPEFENHGLIVSAPGKNYDFVSRFFIPSEGINEDPVTGYAHTLLTPYWAKKFGKTKLTAFQASKRGGELELELNNERVNISGYACFYMQGEISI